MNDFVSATSGEKSLRIACLLEVQTKLKRQIELLGLAIGNQGKLKDFDFAEILARDIPTIKRDMQAIRSMGIQIHSLHGKGVAVEGEIPPDQLQELVLFYLWISNAAGWTDKATKLMVRKKKAQALHTVVSLERAIEQSLVVEIDYQKDGDRVESRRAINPLRLFASEGYWRLLAQHDGIIKQFHLNKIEKVHSTDRKFKAVPREKVEAMFRNSFRSWIGTDEYCIRLCLSRTWVAYLKPRQMMVTESITENPDGSMIIESVVNSLDEVASWVVSRGCGVTVLEPAELREKVIELARGALENYAVVPEGTGRHETTQ